MIDRPVSGVSTRTLFFALLVYGAALACVGLSLPGALGL